MAVRTIPIDPGPLRDSLQAARQLLWMQRGIRIFILGSCVSMSAILLAALLSNWQAPVSVRTALWAAAGISPLASIFIALLARPTASLAARAVDYRLGLSQQLGTAEELLSRGENGDLASLQIARAVSLAEEVDVNQAFTLLPRREMLIAMILTGLVAAMLLVATLGVTVPNPFSALRLPSFDKSTPATAQQEVLGIRQQRETERARSAVMEPLRDRLDEIQRRSQEGSLSAAAAAALLSQASAELNRVASESRTRQEALESLASELRRTAVGREAAEALRQGDFARAAQLLKEAGVTSDQLSSAAKQELADALQRASAQSQQAQALSGSEAAAADALRKGTYSSTVKSMNELSEATKNTAGQVVPQSEIAGAWQRLETLAQQLGASEALDGNDASALAPPVAQGSASTEERNRQLQGDRGTMLSGNMEEQSSGGSMSMGQGQPGDAPGGPALGRENPSLGSGENSLNIEGMIGDRFPGGSEESSEPPSVLREGSSNAGSSLPGQKVTGRTTVPAENGYVPGERKSIVRDYFSSIR